MACFVCGASLNVISAKLGVSMAVASIGRITNAMGHDLNGCLQIGTRTGSIGGLLATSLALGGMAGMWLLVKDTSSLSGFGSGSAIVSFYLRVGGGIFSKGAEIGADLVGENEGNEVNEEEENKVFEMQ